MYTLPRKTLQGTRVTTPGSRRDKARASASCAATNNSLPTAPPPGWCTIASCRAAARARWGTRGSMEAEAQGEGGGQETRGRETPSWPHPFLCSLPACQATATARALSWPPLPCSGKPALAEGEGSRQCFQATAAAEAGTSAATNPNRRPGLVRAQQCPGAAAGL